MRFLFVLLSFLSVVGRAIEIVDLSIYRAQKPTNVETSLYSAFAQREKCLEKAQVAVSECQEKNQNSEAKSPCKKFEEKTVAFCNEFYWSWASSLQTEDHKLCAMERSYIDGKTGKEVIAGIHATECKVCEGEMKTDGPILRFEERPGPGGIGEFVFPVHAKCGTAYSPEDYSWSAPIRCSCEPNIQSGDPIGFDPLQPPVIEFDFTKPGSPVRFKDPRALQPHRPMAVRTAAKRPATARGAASPSTGRGFTHSK